MVSQHNTSLSLKDYNTFGIDTQAKKLILLIDLTQLREISNLQDCLIIGGGSNILLTQDIEQTVIVNQTKGIRTLNENEDTIELAVASGENWHEFVMHCIANEYGGIENMSLIPGSVGAAPMQNIGAYGREVKDVLTYVKAIDIRTLEEVVFSNAECQFGYRESIFKKSAIGKYFICEVGFKLTKQYHKLNTSYGDIEKWLQERCFSSPTLRDVSNAVIAIRKSKLPDPAELGNSGSFFKNPIIDKAHFEKLKEQYPEIKSYPIDETSVKVPAGWLIESMGWKGKKVGNTGSHAKQALVLVNYGGANGQEVYALAKAIQQSVKETYQIHLDMEVNVI
ncbi:UDP-N-acetylmuramate dehydrogenase [Bacteroidia bacterium]|nr:UDP-N-acetylmuramate dehydrogenase [Bacteroidia bacterium]MDB9882115.1 UDP-N-acetylmuramate dehydrogenase [Bacteroidia bacterium]